MLAQEHRTDLHSVSTVVYCDRSMLNTERRRGMVGILRAPCATPRRTVSSELAVVVVALTTVVTSLCVDHGVLQR